MILDVEALLQQFLDRDASDLYLTVGAPPSFRHGDDIVPAPMEALTDDDIRHILTTLLSADILEEFESTFEYNTAVNWQGKARFRINLFRQQLSSGIVIRRIRTEIPDLASLELPPVYAELIMERRGLILIVGPTGSGKSTSLAAMLEHRNLHGSGHIVTIEDPVEYIHKHRGCIVTQRDVGIDTYSFGIGLKNALRQSPDIIVIGEIRDRETMEHAIAFSETGHLCLATLHANNTHQAVERIINFFPEEKHAQVLLNLSFNLKAILSQRLLPNKQGSRTIAIEIMLNQGFIKSLIQEGRVKELRDCIEKGGAVGMRTFDQALIALYLAEIITEETALAEADNPANLRLAITQHHMSSRLSPSRPPQSNEFSSKPQF